jgi:hypothetical protein
MLKINYEEYDGKTDQLRNIAGKTVLYLIPQFF